MVGTGTDVGKTWVSVQLLRSLRGAGHAAAARKPVQSFDLADPVERTDAGLLATASGEEPVQVCPPHRWYPVAMAPPMAASVLRRPAFAVDELAGEVSWPPGIEVGLVETAGGVCSPLAADGDAHDLAAALAPDLVLLVAEAGLGAIHAVRAAMGRLGPGTDPDRVAPVVVALNRFDPAEDLHRRNAAWLRDHDGFEVICLPPGLDQLCRRVLGPPATSR